MVKCPYCKHEVSSKPIKKWKYSNRNVETYECKKCLQKFNFYYTKKFQYTIPKPKNDK